jgi:hypothetical protein
VCPDVQVEVVRLGSGLLLLRQFRQHQTG